jgi:TolB-like protein/Tfp pilus assembly protein PilF
MTPTESSTEVKFEIGHVLFIDIVGYSKLNIHEQSEQLEALKQIVRGTEQFKKAEVERKLLRLPTGDGGALVFFTTPEAPLLCAVEIARALTSYPDLKVRMGIHSGPVNQISDLNEQANIAGAGINIAQRVMDCGDAGHILLSRHVAEDLEAYPRWRPHLHPLGEAEIKHGDRLALVNFYQNDVGNAALPQKLSTKATIITPDTPAKSGTANVGKWLIGGAIGVAAICVLIVAIKYLKPSGGASLATLPAASDKSIAVLPFANLSRDPDNAYFVDGIQDEILTRLSKVAALKVISRTSTQKYKSEPENLRQVGKELGVANLLEGSVQKVANAVHVNVQLIRAASDEHVWAESYNRKLDDVFGVEGEVASAIADQLNTKLTGVEQKALAQKPTQNAAAYDVYLHAVAIDDATSLDVSKQVVPLYAKAVGLDPQFALAWARLSVARSQLFFNGVDPNINTGDRVKEEADRAIQLQPELGEAWLAQGVYRYRVLRDFEGALKSYEEALRRLPNSALVLEQMGHLERRLGRYDAALKHYQTAGQLDPRNIGLLLTIADMYLALRRFDQAQAAIDRILEISPGNEHALASKANYFQTEGRLKEAGEALAQAPANSNEQDIIIGRIFLLFNERQFDAAIDEIEHKTPKELADDPRTITALGWCQKLAGKEDEARVTFDRAIAAYQPTAEGDTVIDARLFPVYLGWAYAGRGEKEKALEQARRAVADYAADQLAKPSADEYLAVIQAEFGDNDSAIAALPHLLEVPNGETVGDLRVDPIWDPLRKDPRFQKLCQDPNK